jgi:L-seryl-tRNA(Ser) seleniumtransferase
MDKALTSPARRLPSVDAVVRSATMLEAVDRFGRPAAVSAVRRVLAEARAERAVPGGIEDVARAALSHLDAQAQPKLQPVFNLTGTVLHTNLGRALIAEAAIKAADLAMRNAVALEFDLTGGRRGERDLLVRELLCTLTGAEDATIVNNNAAAVLLVLNTLARGRDAIVSRGELIEIGGAFRLPEIMSRAGAKLLEVGTTNRTHRKDYAEAIGPRTGLILKVHASNYRIQGFTKAVGAPELAALAHAHQVPLVNDLGSGTLIDLARFGLAHEPTVAEAIAEGADLVTFSGDKLLGGPHASLIVGRAALIAKLNKNPLKRALRVDKIRLAALEATLRLYGDPDRLTQTLPTYRLLTRPIADIETTARRILPALREKLGAAFSAATAPCASQVGSGALPVETLPSFAIAVRPVTARGSGRLLNGLAAALRRLPVPVVGRVENGALLMDLRCLEDADAFIANLSRLDLAGDADGA